VTITLELPDERFGAPVLCDLMTVLNLGPEPLDYLQKGRIVKLKNVVLKDYPVLIRFFEFDQTKAK
jgi:hypothetical protein